MASSVLDFERPIIELQEKIQELRNVGTGINLSNEIKKLEQKSQELTLSIFKSLTPWQITQLARHAERPHMMDYVERIFDDFQELHGDRHYKDDRALLGGIARFQGEPVMVIGNEKGRRTTEKVVHNFGMPRPEGYRKALRLMRLAEKYSLPIITLIDTPGAYPGIGAEERNQSEAIARNLLECAKMRTPIICTVTGEGGSGGALAIAVGDRLNMLQYSIFSVISPEGCASILWRTPEKALEAAAAMGVHAERINELGLLDAIIPEPLGGAHRDKEAMALALQNVIAGQLAEVKAMTMDELLDQRYQRLLNYGLPHYDV
ncbi:MAG: acetyl-CoA carboxylase carboxyltransferase subunit alpha [Gammaproteobacteria bacterium]